MSVAVSPEHLEEFLELSEKMNVISTVLGEFTDSGKFHVLYKGKTVAYLNMDFLHEGLPKMNLTAKWERKIRDEKPFREPDNLGNVLLGLLGRWNVCSKEYVVRQYDHEVEGGSVVKPLIGLQNNGPSNAGVVKPDLDGKEGIVISHGICPKYSAFDTYHMMACAIDEAIRNNIATGGSLVRMALLDNFCWSDPILSEKNPEGPYKLAQLVRANRALYDSTTFFGTPCISGKDSMKNDYMFDNIKISVPQTVLISALSVIEDARRVMTMDFKGEGDLVIMVGKTYPELAGSEYFASNGLMGNIPPRVRMAMAKRIFKTIEKAMKQNLLRSCHDVSDGGLGCALAESSFAGGFGVTVDLNALPATGIFRDDFILFSESQSRFVVSIREKDLDAFAELFRSIPFGVIGKTTREQIFKVKGIQGKTIIELPTQHLLEAWQAPFKEHFGG
jgi:phosphoribosylformylglycinamidine synthase